MKKKICLFCLLLLSTTAIAGENQPMTPSIAEVKQQHEARLLALPGVVSVGIGRDDEGQVCIVIGMSRQQPQSQTKIRKLLGDTPYTVEVIGSVKPLKP